MMFCRHTLTNYLNNDINDLNNNVTQDCFKPAKMPKSTEWSHFKENLTSEQRTN